MYKDHIFTHNQASQWSLTCAGYVALFCEFHVVKTETNKELFDKQCPLLQYRKSGKTWGYETQYFILI